VNESTFQGVS